MSPKETNNENAILKAACDQAQQPITVINGQLESQQNLSEYINDIFGSPARKGVGGVVVYYRTIERLFPSSSLSPYYFDLSIPDYAELRQWAKSNDLEVDYLKNTEDMKLRPFHFTLLNKAQ